MNIPAFRARAAFERGGANPPSAVLRIRCCAKARNDGDSVRQIDKDEALAWAALLARAGRGDVEAFEDFYRRSAHWALGVATDLVGADGAEPFMQVLYVSIWQQAASFDAGQGAPQNWLSGLARRLAARP